MESQSKIFAMALVGVALVAFGLLLQPTIEDRLAPEPSAAWVAIEPTGPGAEGVAEIGRVELAHAAPFVLRAVLEADDDGETIYYTDARRLRIAGEEIPAERLRPFKRARRIHIRWYTVEASPPYLEISSAEDLERLAWREIYRPDQPNAWTIPGFIRPADSASPDLLPRQSFGTLRYHVQFELYGLDDDALLPETRLRSWGAADLVTRGGAFPGVVMTLSGRLAPATRVFALPQIERAAGVPPEALAEEIADLSRRGLGFSRALMLRDLLRAADRRFEDLVWRIVDLNGEARWNDPVRPGDLMRVGDRVVVLYEDHGIEGIVDGPDLCFDYVRGAAVRRLDEVFDDERVGGDLDDGSLDHRAVELAHRGG